jgi:hypothetical protein
LYGAAGLGQRAHPWQQSAGSGEEAAESAREWNKGERQSHSHADLLEKARSAIDKAGVAGAAGAMASAEESGGRAGQGMASDMGEGGVRERREEGSGRNSTVVPPAPLSAKSLMRGRGEGSGSGMGNEGQRGSGREAVGATGESFKWRDGAIRSSSGAGALGLGVSEVGADDKDEARLESARSQVRRVLDTA